jgi:hypothetical protein
LKKEVLDDLPDKIREILYLSGDKIRNQLEALRRSREAYNQAEKSGVSINVAKLKRQLFRTVNKHTIAS